MIKDSFRRYLEEAIGSEKALVAFSAFDTPSPVSVRVNPYKPYPSFEGRQVAWCRYGCMLPQRPVFTLDPCLHGGAYYVQDSSSMFVGHVFREMMSKVELPADRPVRVLDLCAAPGGKSTDLATSLRDAFGDRFLLVSNEVMKQRAGVLADNMAIWGDPNVAVTSDDPRAFAALPDFFDIIVTDVPCSGEGMFRKDEEAQNQWSEDTVALCEARQRRIVADMWPALKTGGLLIYSTCTFNRYENDGNVKWMSEELGAQLVESSVREFPGVIKTECGYSLVPGHVEGEGQYCAALIKTEQADYVGSGSSKADRSRKENRNNGTLTAWPKGLFTVGMTFRQKGETVVAVPETVAQDVETLESCLHVIAAGCAAGVFKGKTFIPDADLALSLKFNSEAYPHAEVDRQTALAFLHRDAISLPESEKGYVVIRYEGLPLGFVKNLGNRCNNLHPQARRIRMDINK